MFRQWCLAVPKVRFFQRRCFATAKNTPGDVPAKPKAKTSLRRTAAESLPIRSNKTATRSEIQTVFTLATAERYLLSRLRGLPADASVLHDCWWIPKWSPKDKDTEGEIFIFANGSFVCWGLGEDDAARFASEVIARAPEAQVARLKENETEELEFVMDPIELVVGAVSYRDI
jgi:uncharacterized Rmd1/YagE family protein